MKQFIKSISSDQKRNVVFLFQGAQKSRRTPPQNTSSLQWNMPSSSYVYTPLPANTSNSSTHLRCHGGSHSSFQRASQKLDGKGFWQEMHQRELLKNGRSLDNPRQNIQMQYTNDFGYLGRNTWIKSVLQRFSIFTWQKVGKNYRTYSFVKIMQQFSGVKLLL